MSLPATMVRNGLFIGLALLLTACSVMPPQPDEPDLSKIVIVDVPAASEMISAQIPVLDVRTPEEWDQGHVTVARLAPLDELPQVLVPLHLDVDEPVLIYCRSGNRALKSGLLMADVGYTHVYVLRPGGYEQLRTAGVDVIAPEP